MASIDIKSVGNLLIVSVAGELTSDEMIKVVKDYYPNEIVKDVIWDISNGSLISISQDGFKSIAMAVKESLANGSRQGGKTVFVGNSEVECCLLVMYTEIAKLTGVPIKYDVFKTVEEVRSWLK